MGGCSSAVMVAAHGRRNGVKKFKASGEKTLLSSRHFERKKPTANAAMVSELREAETAPNEVRVPDPMEVAEEPVDQPFAITVASPEVLAGEVPPPPPTSTERIVPISVEAPDTSHRAQNRSAEVCVGWDHQCRAGRCRV
mmetsp:Transcript_16386/g.38427  ORF Transcript_16386/g.38427 Transcript_16386/m.38427 type:complete len:140 (+) Transcript_16386:54-473(+)